MSKPLIRLARRLLTSVGAVVAFGLAAPSGRAELMVNGLPDAVQETANFLPCSSVAARDESDADLLDGLFHPVGLMMGVAYLPVPSWAPPPPPPSSGEPPPEDPTITIHVPLPSTVPDPVTPPVTSTVTGPSTPPGSSPPTDIDGLPSVHHSPEPATFVSGMLGMSLLGWFGWRRRRQS